MDAHSRQRTAPLPGKSLAGANRPANRLHSALPAEQDVADSKRNTDKSKVQEKRVLVRQWPRPLIRAHILKLLLFSLAGWLCL